MKMQMSGFQGLLRHWRDDTGGNIMVLMALVMVAIMGLAGMAIDLRYTLSQKEKVQYALDSAVLAGALERQKGRTDEEVKAEVRQYAGALIGMQGGGMTCAEIAVSMDNISEDITARVSCVQPTFISQILGQDHLDFTVSTTSTYSVGKVDVAFVFDVSGSMNSYNRVRYAPAGRHAGRQDDPHRDRHLQQFRQCRFVHQCGDRWRLSACGCLEPGSLCQLQFIQWQAHGRSGDQQALLLLPDRHLP
jgi:Flp pilus assembly protein TadG